MLCYWYRMLYIFHLDLTHYYSSMFSLLSLRSFTLIIVNLLLTWCCYAAAAAISHYHTSDSRRSYQIIKFLVNLVNKCPLAKDYLLQAATRWQWAVNWLKSKVRLYWWPDIITVTIVVCGLQWILTIFSVTVFPVCFNFFSLMALCNIRNIY